MTRAGRKLLLVGDSSTLWRRPFFVALFVYVKWVWSTALHLRRVNRAEAVITIVAQRARESVMTGLG